MLHKLLLALFATTVCAQDELMVEQLLRELQRLPGTGTVLAAPICDPRKGPCIDPYDGSLTPTNNQTPSPAPTPAPTPEDNSGWVSLDESTTPSSSFIEEEVLGGF